jgi:hypothetical protein
MEAHTSSLTQARATVLSRIDKVPGAETAPSISRWRERAPLLAAIAVTAMAGVSFVLGFSWLAVISVNAEREASAGLGPWAIACAILAAVAFVVGLASLLRPRVRVTLVAVASFLMILLVTTVIGFTMSAPPQDLDVRAADVIGDEK